MTIEEKTEEELGRAQTPATKAKIAKAMTGKKNHAYKDGRRSYDRIAGLKDGEKKGKVVDHRDGDSTNNKPSNLKIMSKADHEKKHKREGNFKKSGGRKAVPRGYQSKT